MADDEETDVPAEGDEIPEGEGDAPEEDEVPEEAEGDEDPEAEDVDAEAADDGAEGDEIPEDTDDVDEGDDVPEGSADEDAETTDAEAEEEEPAEAEVAEDEAAETADAEDEDGEDEEAETADAADEGEETPEAAEDEDVEEDEELEEIETAMAGEGEEDEEEPPSQPTVESEGRFYGTGRRKEAVARVWVEAGSGNITVNGNDLGTYFSNRAKWTEAVRGPLECLDMEDAIDVWATAEGGGLTGQADAIELGLARALVDMDENARHWLRPEGHLTRDDREVERKKINQPGARAKSQVSKR